MNLEEEIVTKVIANTEPGIAYPIPAGYVMSFKKKFLFLRFAKESIKENNISDDKKAIKLDKGVFDTSSIYNIGSFILMIILALLYSFFW